MTTEEIKKQKRENKSNNKIIEAGYSEIREAFNKENSSKNHQKDNSRKYYI